VRIEREGELDEGLARAMGAPGPFVVDVAIDPHEPPAMNRRNSSLRRQVSAFTDTRSR